MEVFPWHWTASPFGAVMASLAARLMAKGDQAADLNIQVGGTWKLNGWEHNNTLSVSHCFRQCSSQVG